MIEGVGPADDSSETFRIQEAEIVERSPRSSPRQPFCEVWDLDNENDLQFQLFWKDEKPPVSSPQVINYSLPRMLSQSAKRTSRNISPRTHRQRSSAHESCDEPFSFHALRSDDTPSAFSSRISYSERGTGHTPTFDWELKAFTDDSRWTPSHLQPETSAGAAGHGLPTSSGQMHLNSLTQPADIHFFDNERPFLAQLQKHSGSIASGQSSDESHLLTPLEDTLPLPRSRGGHLMAARRESAVWPMNEQFGTGQENKEICLVYS